MSEDIRGVPSFYIENILHKNEHSFHVTEDPDEETNKPPATHNELESQQADSLFPGSHLGNEGRTGPHGDREVYMCDESISMERCAADKLCTDVRGHDNGTQPEGQDTSGCIPVIEDRKPDVDLGGAGDDGKKRPRTAFSADQVRSLEQEFQRSKYLSVSKRTEMSRQLGLTEQQIKIWFQNRRTKWKRKYTNNLEILAQQHYLRMGLLPAYSLQPAGGAAGGKPTGQYGGMFGGGLGGGLGGVRPAFPTPSPTVRLYPSFGGHSLPRM